MKIERSRFLSLVTAIAAGVSVAPGCHEVEPPPAASAGAGAVETTGARLDIPIPIPAPSPGAADAAGSSSPNPYEGTPIAAKNCSPALNREGQAPSCSLKAPGPTCESFVDTVKECPTLNQLLKPRVAEAAIACLRRKSGTQEICEFNVTSICAYEALGSACLDPAAKAPCQGVMARCGSEPHGHYNKMTREACEAGVSGIADAKRQKFISCISESCRFETCLTYL